MTTAPQQSINTTSWLGLLAEKRSHELCRQIIAVINWYGDRTLASLDVAARQQLNDLLNLILFLIAFPTFEIPDDLAVPFIQLNRTLSNLLALSGFKNTDAHLEVIKQQPNNLVRLLALYSARNNVRLDMRIPFQINPHLASIWYVQVAQLFHAGLPSETVFCNLQEHFAAVPDNLVPVPGMQEIYLGSTYVDPQVSRLARERVNQAFRRHTARVTIYNRPNPRKIAVCCSQWRADHPVARHFAAFLKALKPDYHLTLVNLGAAFDQKTLIFDDIRTLPSTNGIPDPTSLLQNDFQLVCYPNLGQGSESIFLSNLRLAPIQIAAGSQSVSSFGAEIDYFISGAEVETAEAPEQNYSERLVLLPATGFGIDVPDYPRPAAAAEPPTDPILINCAWAGHKINFPFLKPIAGLLNACRRPVRLQVFEGGATLQKNDFLPFTEALSALLPLDKFQIVINQPYEQYMAQLQKGHLALDSFHVGGCNTVSDSIYLGIPIVCRQGDQRHNRVGPQMLRLAGMPELAMNSERDYLETADRLIHDDAFRHSLRLRLQQAPLTDTLYGNADAVSFKTAIDLLIAQHGSLQRDTSRSPIRIPRV